MTAALIGAAGIAVVAFVGWATLPARIPALVWAGWVGVVAFLCLTILHFVRRSRADLETRTQRKADRSREARVLADRIAVIAADAQALVLSIRGTGSPSEAPVEGEFAEIGRRAKVIYEEAYSKGYRSDGVERELGGLRSIDDLERLGTALHRLSQEIAHRF